MIGTHATRSKTRNKPSNPLQARILPVFIHGYLLSGFLPLRQAIKHAIMQECLRPLSHCIVEINNRATSNDSPYPAQPGQTNQTNMLQYLNKLSNTRVLPALTRQWFVRSKLMPTAAPTKTSHERHSFVERSVRPTSVLNEHRPEVSSPIKEPMDIDR